MYVVVSLPEITCSITKNGAVVCWSWASFGGGGDRGTCPPHILKGGGHNIKCPPTFFEHVCVSPQKSYILINLD